MSKERDDKIAALAEVSRLREQLATALVLPSGAKSSLMFAIADVVQEDMDDHGIEYMADKLLDLLRSWGVSSSKAPQPHDGDLQWSAVYVKPGTTDPEDADAPLAPGWWVLGVDPESPDMPVVQMRVEPGPDCDGGEGPVARWIAGRLEKAAREARSATGEAGMTQHQVRIYPGDPDIWNAYCQAPKCGQWSGGGTQQHAEDWKGQHEADTLRPQPADVRVEFATVEEFDSTYKGHGGQCVSYNGHPTYRCEWMVGHEGDHRRYVGPYEWELWKDAASAARSEATPQDPPAVVATETEPSGAVMTECPDGAQCHRECVAPACIRVATCGPMSRVFPSDRWPHEVVAKHGPGSLTEDPSPSLRKEGEDRG